MWALALGALGACLLSASLSWAQDRFRLAATASSQLLQNARADEDNLSRMRNHAMLRRFHAGGYLVPVRASAAHYYLHAVPAQYRYLRPWSRLFLERLSRQFYARFHRRLRVTSLVRTVQRQIHLAGRNGNAAAVSGARRSSHLTGATLDISKRFMSPAQRSWMRRVLHALKTQGYLYAIEEFRQPTFHIMVYRNYPEYVRRLEAASHELRLRVALRRRPGASAASGGEAGR